MKYILLKEIPGAKVGDIIENIANYGSMIDMKEYPDFFEPILEKKTYDDLKEGDRVFIQTWGGEFIEYSFSIKSMTRSETFLTREEAEDEHKRREWACRKDKFIPEDGERYFYASVEGLVRSWINELSVTDIIVINSGHAFRSEIECSKAIKEHDLIRLFYTIR